MKKTERFGEFWMVPKGGEGLSLQARFLLGMFITYSNGENESWPSQWRMAEELCVSERSVRRYVTELEDAGLLKIIQRGLQQTNTYVLTGQFGRSGTDKDGRSGTAADDLSLLYKKRTLIKEQAKCVEKTTKPERSIEWVRSVPDGDVEDLVKKYKVSTKCVLDRAQDVIDYCEAKGKKYSDYKAALRNFIKSHIERHPDAIQRETRAFQAPKEDHAPQMDPEARRKANEKLAEMRANLARKKSMD